MVGHGLLYNNIKIVLQLKRLHGYRDFMVVKLPVRN